MPEVELNYERLRDLERKFRDDRDEHLAVRTHRCISWVGRAESEFEKDDLDASFIFYWIAFNSIYSVEQFYRAGSTEKDLFADFFRVIVELDRDQTVYNAIWDRFSDSIRILLNNRFVFQPFWVSINNGDEDWERLFRKANRQTLEAFRRRDTVAVLGKMFDRLYVLRNQLMHGGATWNSNVNRSQVRDGARILRFLVPIFVDIMMKHPGIAWSKPYYPVVSERQ